MPKNDTQKKLVSFLKPAEQVTVAQNTMTIVHLLKMTGVLVTRCAGLHYSAVFLVNVAHGQASLGAGGVQSLSTVLEMEIDALFMKTKNAKERNQLFGDYLKRQNRLDNTGLAIRDEDELLKLRFPEVVQVLESKDTQSTTIPVPPKKSVVKQNKKVLVVDKKPAATRAIKIPKAPKEHPTVSGLVLQKDGTYWNPSWG